jgi:Lrp/AsnC family leucine-responsive transcriptional regulator
MAYETTAELDDVDWKLIEVLQEDGRISFAELGRRVSLSAPAVAERVRRLETAGIITGYRAEVDLNRLGLGMQAVIRVMAAGPDCSALGRWLEAMPEVLEARRVTGSDSHVLRVAVRSVEHLEDLLNRLMAHSSDSVTSIVLSTPVSHRTVTRELASPPAGEGRTGPREVSRPAVLRASR